MCTRSGFTIVELLIVVVVIAILATIVVIAYNGIRQRAVDSSVQSSVKQASTKIEAFFITNNESYPPTLSSIGVEDTPDTTYAYTYDNSSSPQTYCVSATSGTTSYHLTNAQRTLTNGACEEPADLSIYGPSGAPYATTLENDGSNLKVATLFHSNTTSFTVKGARVYLPSVPSGSSLTVFYIVSWYNNSLIRRPDWPEIPSSIPGQYVTLPSGSLTSGWNSVTFPTQPTINPRAINVDGTSVWIGYYFSDGNHYIHYGGAPNATIPSTIGSSDLFIHATTSGVENRSAYTTGGSPGWSSALYGIDITATRP